MHNEITSLILDGEDHADDFNKFATTTGIEKLAPGRVSLMLLMDMYRLSLVSPYFESKRIFDEVRYLEGKGSSTGSKPQSKFNRNELKGLWHKHYQVGGATAVVKNLDNALNTYGLPEVRRRVQAAEQNNGKQYFTMEDVPLIVNDAMENYKRRIRAQQLTGEWIIYATYNRQNYYLCLGTHDTGDDKLRGKIDELCVHEFPFLVNLLSAKK